MSTKSFKMSTKNLKMSTKKMVSERFYGISEDGISVRYCTSW